VISQSTRDKFKYPQSLVKEYEHWEIYLRPNQVTLGSLILICKTGVKSFHEVSAEAHVEMRICITEIEKTLHKLWGYDKINYLMLMMKDPEVHFHVIPRYEKLREFQGVVLKDHGWPKVPDMENPHILEDVEFISLRDYIQENWVSV
jgi:diadenosine tetraphosphate (Ap4A) HIT family hydrolase